MRREENSRDTDPLATEKIGGPEGRLSGEAIHRRHKGRRKWTPF